MIYLIGSLRNPEIPKIANTLRKETGEEVFDDWMAAGPEADDYWRDYEKGKGHSYSEALAGAAAKNVYEFDRRHLIRCRAAVLVLPAGKSGHLELGYILGAGKPGYILLNEEPERFDVMYQFATAICNNLEELIVQIKSPKNLFPEKFCQNPGLHVSIPRLGISCGCPSCLRDRRDRRGSGLLEGKVFVD